MYLLSIAENSCNDIMHGFKLRCAPAIADAVVFATASDRNCGVILKLHLQLY